MAWQPPDPRLQRLLNSIRGGGPMGQNEYRVLNVPRASIYRAAAQVVSNNVQFSVIWDSVEYDTDSMWSAANPTILTIKTPGIYRVQGWWTWEPNGTGQRGLLIWKTNAATAAQSLYPAFGLLGEGHSIIAQTGGLYTVHGPQTYDIPMNKGDWLTMRVMQFTAPIVNLNAIVATTANHANGLQATLISTL